MQGILCSWQAWRRRQKDTLSPEAKDKLAKKFIELSKEWTRGVDKKGNTVFKNVKDSGYNNWETFEWLYTKFTNDASLDPEFQPLNFKKFRKFKFGLDIYNRQLAQKRSAFARKFFLPRATLQNLPELARFERNLHREQSYYRDFTQSSEKNINAILSSMKEIAGEEGGMIKSLLVKGGIIDDGSAQLRKL